MLPDTFRHVTMASGIRCSMARGPGKTALICGDRSLTYAALVDRIDGVAAMAAGLGLVAGDRAAIVASNCLEYIEIVDGLAEAGIAVATPNPRQTAAELRYVLEDCGARVAFVSAEAEAMVRDCPSIERIIVIGPEYEALLQGAQRGGVGAVPEWGAFSIPLHVGHHGQTAGRGAAAPVTGADRVLHGVGIWVLRAG